MTVMIEDEEIESTETETGAEVADEPLQLGEAEILAERIAVLEAELAESKAAVLYAHAEAQNVRRRSEKEAIDARAYAVTGFARDILSVADNLSRGLAAMPDDLRATANHRVSEHAAHTDWCQADRVAEPSGRVAIDCLA